MDGLTEFRRGDDAAWVVCGFLFPGGVDDVLPGLGRDQKSEARGSLPLSRFGNSGWTNVFGRRTD